MNSLLVTFTLGMLAGCGDSSTPTGETDGSDESSSTATVVDSSGATTADTSTSDGADETGGTSGTGGPVDELPAPVLPEELYNYDTPLPEHLQVDVVLLGDNTPPNNPISDAGATLGRVLFYDKRMSRNGTVSCATCHEQATSFSDSRQLSVGFDGGETGRHSMSLINLRYFPRGSMFWDQRAATLEEQVLMPIQDEIEMGMTLEELVERLSATDYYAPLFEDAFGDSEVTSERISLALAQFVRSIVSFDSRFDQEVAAAGDVRPDFPGFTDEENRGKTLFFGEHDLDTRGLCGSCHMYANPTMFLPPEGAPGAPKGEIPELENLGIFHQLDPVNNGFTDESDDGVGGVTGDSAELGAFKSSSLRNIALTGPYMHDGRFATLADVVNHYNEGVEDHPNLGPALLDFDIDEPFGPDNIPTPIRLGLDESDQAALVAFLGTLTDESVLTDVRWSDPFPTE